MIDIKQIKKIINSSFSKYHFVDDTHSYYYYDEEGNKKYIGISTTQLIHSYSQPFDEDKMSKIVARKKGMSQQEVLDLWNNTREISCDYGTLAHLYLEMKWEDLPFLYSNKNYIEKYGYDAVSPQFEKIKPALDLFYETFKDRLIIIGAEVLICSEYYDIAGSIDLLAYSKKLNSIIIIDNKSNKEIKKTSYNNQTMIYPLNNISDSNYWHYSLQGAIYKEILYKETGIMADARKFLIWFNLEKETYEIIECANLDKEAKIILEERAKNVKD